MAEVLLKLALGLSISNPNFGLIVNVKLHAPNFLSLDEGCVKILHLIWPTYFF